MVDFVLFGIHCQRIVSVFYCLKSHVEQVQCPERLEEYKGHFRGFKDYGKAEGRCRSVDRIPQAQAHGSEKAGFSTVGYTLGNGENNVRPWGQDKQN